MSTRIRKLEKFDNSQINPYVVSRVIQSDGCFTVNISKTKSGFGFILVPSFQIELIRTSLPLLKAIQRYFGGVGILSLKKDGKYVKYSITRIEDMWHILIPHFTKYGLYGSKYVSFIKFVNVLILLFPYQNKSKPAHVLMKRLVIMIDMNNGSGRDVEDIFCWLYKLKIEPDFYCPLYAKYLQPLLTVNMHFFVGIMEGDGSTYFGFNVKGKPRFGFNITTNIRDLYMLHAIKNFLGFGNIKLHGTWCRIESESVNSLWNLLIPIIDKVGLLGSKAEKYDTFRQVLVMYKNKEHLTKKGLAVIKGLQKRMKELLKNKGIKSL